MRNRAPKPPTYSLHKTKGRAYCYVHQDGKRHQVYLPGPYDSPASHRAYRQIVAAYMTGEPIQPLYTGHVDRYVDYSHGVRLVAREMKIDGRRTTLSQVLSDPVLHSLLSDEGLVPLDCQRYRLR